MDGDYQVLHSVMMESRGRHGLEGDVILINSHNCQ